jgi:hypothetical protein
MAGVSATLELEASEALAIVDQIESGLTAAADSFGVALSQQIDSVTGATVEVEADTTSLTAEIDSAVAEASGEQLDLFAEVDTSGVAPEIEDAVDSVTPEPVEIPVNTDNAKEQIEGLSSSLGEIGTQDAAAGLDAFGGSAAGAGGLAQAAKNPVLALAAALGLSGAAAGEANLANAQLDQILINTGNNAGVSGDHIRALATDIMEYSGISDEAVIAGASTVLMFENVRNAAGQPIFDRAIKSSADLARSPAFSGDITAAARTLGRALDDPVQGMSRLRRAGIQLTESQEATITSLQEAGQLEEAQAALLDVVEGRVGSLAETYGNELPGGIDKAKESFGELAEEIGSGLAGPLNGLAGFLAGAADGFRLLNADLGESSPLRSFMNDDWDPSIDLGLDQIFGKGTQDAIAKTTEETEEFTAAQEEAQAAVAATVPTLAESIANVDKAGEAFGILSASSDPQAVIDNLGLMIFAFDDFQANLNTIAGEGLSGPGAAFPRISAALQALGPEVAGGLAEALTQADAATKLQLDNLIGQVERRSGDVNAVFSAFATGGMTAAIDVVNASAPGMGAAGTAAGAEGAAGIDAGLSFTNAAEIGQITGVQYGAGVFSGINSMRGAISSIANSVVASAGSTSAAFNRGQALGTAYGSGLVAGLAGQIGNVVSTATSLRTAGQVESATTGTVDGSTSVQTNTISVPVVVNVNGNATADDAAAIAGAVGDSVERTLRERHIIIDTQLA